MSVEFASNNTVKRPFHIFINNDVKVINRVINNIHHYIVNPHGRRFSLAEVRQLLINTAEIIDKRLPLTTDNYSSGRSQSVAWYFVNEYLEGEVDESVNDAINKLLLQLAIAFDCIGNIAAEGIPLEHLNVARDLNETMKLLHVPISFHHGVYGRPDDDILRSRAGRSSLRRPIAKAELVLSWAAHMLRLTRRPTKYTKTELTFINLLGTMLDVFVKRHELIANGKYSQPCIDHLAFIRLMELVYITIIRATGIKHPFDVYASLYDCPPQFDYIQDFSDIRMSLEGVMSHLSRLPRNISEHSSKHSVFYNPVKCSPESPIYLATSSWLTAIRIMQEDNTFDSIVKETAKASFCYEHAFTHIDGEDVKDPCWYDGVDVFTLTDSNEDAKLLEEQSAVIKEALIPIEKSIKDIGLDNLTGFDKEDDIKVVFSVMLRSNETDKPELSYISI